MYEVRTFFENLMEDRYSGKLRIMLNKNSYSYMIFSDDENLLLELSYKLHKYNLHPKLGRLIKPAVWQNLFKLNQGIDEIDDKNNYYVFIEFIEINRACEGLKLDFDAKKMADELEKCQAVFSTDYNANKLEVDLSCRRPRITLRDFKQAYKKQYTSEIFINFWDKTSMKHKLEQLQSMDEVEQHAHERSDSRTAHVLNRLKFGK